MAWLVSGALLLGALLTGSVLLLRWVESVVALADRTPYVPEE